MDSEVISNEISQHNKISNVYSNEYDNENHLIESSEEPEKRLKAIQRSQDVLKSLRKKAITRVIKPQLLAKCMTTNSAIIDNNLICVKNISGNNILKVISTCQVESESFNNTKTKDMMNTNDNIHNILTLHPINTKIINQENEESINMDNIPRNPQIFKNILLQHKGRDLSETMELPEQNNSDEETETSEAITTRVLSTLGISTSDLFSIKTNQDSRLWICPIKECEHLSQRLFALKIHILEHYRCKPFKCDFEDCDWAFYTAFKLKRHKEIHSGNKDYFCSEDGCLKRFTTIYNLRLHRKLHERPKIHKCGVPECVEIFRTRRELEKHLKIHDPVYAPYKCPVESCGNSYFSHSALISHSRSHQYKLNELQCQWENCGKMFDQPCRLKEHMRQHTGDKPYKCQYENCTSSFVSSSKLRRHERSHVNDRKYTCTHENCDKSFFRKEHLKQHVAMRHEQNFITCPETDCGLVFLSKSCLNRHISNMHTGQKKAKKRKPKSENNQLNENSPTDELTNENESSEITSELNSEQSTLYESTIDNECYENIEQPNGSPDLWINFDEINYSSQNMQAQSNNTIQFNLPDMTGTSGLISDELKNLIDECTMQTQSEFGVAQNSTEINSANIMDNTNIDNCNAYEVYNEPAQADNVDLSEINKFYNGITLENGISVKIGDLSENLEENIEECCDKNENIQNEYVNIPLVLEHLRELIDAGNCTLQVNDDGDVTILETEIVNNSIVPIFPETLLHDENDILETVKKKKVEMNNVDTCARTFFTYQQFCEDRSIKLNKLQYVNDKDDAQNEILDNALISVQSEIVNNNSIDNSDISYDVDDFEIDEQYMSLINEGASAVYKIQEVNDLDCNSSKLRLQAYPSAEDKLDTLCNETDIDNLNWVNKSLNDSNDGFNFEMKREHISSNSFMQYEMIESFDEKHSQNSLHVGIGELLTIDNLDPHFYESGDITFTANNIRIIKDSI